MKVVYCPVGLAPTVWDIEDDLESLQEMVNGNIEVLSLTDNIVLVCNEDGKLLGLKPNCKVKLNGQSDVIVGNYFLCRVNGENFESFRKGDWEKIRKFIWRYERLSITGHARNAERI